MYVLFTGDDVGGLFTRKFYITINTDLNLTDCVVEFKICGVTKVLTGVTAGERKEVVFSRVETASFGVGMRVAKLSIFDPQGRYRTIANDILVKCTDVVSEVYDGENNNLSYTLGVGISWDSISDKPNNLATTEDIEEAKQSIVNALDGLEVSDTATQRETRAALQSLLARLRGIVSCVAALASLSLFAIDSTTEWQDVPPTNTVKGVVDLFAPTPDFTTNNAALVETIQATAPAPGNYAVVSNAAVHAAITNALQDAALANKLSTSGGEVTGDIRMPTGLLDAGDVQTRSMFDFLKPGQAVVKSLDAPENSGKALTDADISDSSSAIGAALAGKANDNAVVNLTDDQTIDGYKTFSERLDLNDGLMVYMPDPYLTLADSANPATLTIKQNEYGEWGLESFRLGSDTYFVALPYATGTIALESAVAASATASTNYTDAAVLSAATDATNYTDSISSSIKQSIPNNITRTATDATLVHCDSGNCTNALVYIRQASSSLAGLMTAADKSALDAMKTTVSTHDAAIQTVTNDNAQTRQIVATWENFLDGSNVVFSITNYLSGTYNLDAAKMTIKELRDGEYREVYNSRDEILLHLNDFKTNDFRIATNQVIGSVNAAIVNKADRDWGKYTSAGGEAPENTVYMTAPNTVFAGGLEYERVAVGEGAICVLTTHGAPVWTQGDEGTFKFQDDGGTNYFGFAKTDSYTIGANTDGITVQGGMVTMNYNITMSGRPCVWYKADLTSDTPWEQLNLPDGSPVAGASHAVTWESNPDPGTQVCYINVGNAPSGFFRATVEVAGEAKFMTNMPADLSGGIICTNTATGVKGVIKPAYNGTTVQWTWSAL